ncbi:MAG: MGMT family protein [Calditrichaeota bacterium]|nr:MAG: MGMT family protein [Calditrichota bacterium]
MSSPLFDKIYEIILQIPKGKVATYGQVATMAGNHRAARAVGWLLASLPEGSPVPWHRVLNAQGKSSFPSEMKRRLQQALLEAEGVRFDEQARVNLQVFQWNGRPSTRA